MESHGCPLLLAAQVKDGRVHVLPGAEAECPHGKSLPVQNPPLHVASH